MIKGTPSKETIVNILDRLSSDNDFREHFLGDPAGALKEYGVDVDAQQVPAVRTLPSAEECAKWKSRVAGAEQPDFRAALFPFLLR